MDGKESALSPKLIDFFKQYIELDTSLSSGENYPETISLFDQLLKDFGFTNETVKIPQDVAGGPNRVNLIARRFVSENLPTLLIYNHIDVVPATHENAFKFQIKEGKAFGRGSADQKGGTVAILSALEKIQDKNPRFNILFLATTDEETEQLEQLRYITKRMALPKNAVVFDADTFAGGVTVGTLGMLDLEVLIKGSAAHSAMSHLGKNAIEDAGKLITFFTTVKKRLKKQKSKIKPFKSTGTDETRSQCSVTMISGGTAPNIIPEACRLTANCRFIPEVDVNSEKDRILKEIEGFCKQENIDYEVVRIHTIPGHAGQHPLAFELNQVYQEVTGEGGLYCALGSTPLVQWIQELGLPGFSLGTIRGDNNIHGADEFVYIQDVVNLSKTLEKFLTP